jgi:opacity protein-like surface antigen
MYISNRGEFIMKFNYLTTTSLVALAASATTLQAENFTGAYFGLSYDKGSISDSDYDTSNTGIFAGYNMAVANNWRAGLEFSAAVGDVSMDSSTSPGSYDAKNAWDIKARFGYAFTKAMVYGFVGESQTSLGTGGYGPSSSIGASGMNFGLGVEYLVTDKISLGLEVMRRKMDVDTGYGSSEFETTTASFRAALRF